MILLVSETHGQEFAARLAQLMIPLLLGSPWEKACEKPSGEGPQPPCWHGATEMLLGQPAGISTVPQRFTPLVNVPADVLAAL